MPTPWDSNIARVTTGLFNTVNDLYIGGPNKIGTDARYAGQLGKILTIGNDQIAQMFDSTVGNLYGGRYQYVKRRATDPASPTLAAGKLAFWDTTVSNWQTAFQATTDENISTNQNATIRAGVWLNAVTPGNYGWIFIGGGITPIRFRSVLTASGVTGSPVYAAGAGDAGDDEGTADVLSTDSTALANEKFLGWAITAPTGGSLTNVLVADDAFAHIYS